MSGHVRTESKSAGRRDDGESFQPVGRLVVSALTFDVFYYQNLFFNVVELV